MSESQDIEVTPSRQELLDTLFKIYGKQPNEENFKIYSEDAVFEDPFGQARGIDAIKSQFIGLDKLFSSSVTKDYKVLASEPEFMRLVLHQIYTIPVIQYDLPVESIVNLYLTPEGRIKRHEDLLFRLNLKYRSDGIVGYAWEFGTSKYVRISMLSSLLQAVVICTLEAIVYNLHLKQLAAYSKVSKVPPLKDKALSIYYILFIIAQIFQLILCLDATYNKNTIQVIALAIFNFLAMGYAILQHIQAKNIIVSENIADIYPGYNASRNLEYAIIILMLIFSLSFAYEAYQLYQEYGWNIYKKIGADLRMRSIYKVYQILLMLLKFDIFFLLGFSVQYLALVIDTSQSPGNDELIIHVTVSLCGTISMMILSFWALRAENRFGIIVFMLACFTTLGYLIYKLVIMYTPDGSLSYSCRINGESFSRKCDRFEGSRYFLTFFVIVCFLLGLATVAFTFKALRNFGQGLKQHINHTAVNWNGSLNLDSPEAQKRWSID
ncbi:hypothetical protein K493DRAFT_345774 [Basidiobolus meristosporus CBS 931.73]|uniref:Uncharacterized protein n=1 Tax=Basidiobolus meristosporus CBS 931.73 TaxID=1314790 RepID=A0A1Y1Z1J6_9FUNG|nr:hypothetical protein K493DRAFT_345774 [Basidiobolus meristosporus CBS 931.73]|eukprot:ORY04161.1 hypothetical protein K493DRAFT_345774 [Basidiobolus meristosporus CBS 931.73]